LKTGFAVVTGIRTGTKRWRRKGEARFASHDPSPVMAKPVFNSQVCLSWPILRIQTRPRQVQIMRPFDQQSDPSQRGGPFFKRAPTGNLPGSRYCRPAVPWPRYIDPQRTVFCHMVHDMPPCPDLQTRRLICHIPPPRPATAAKDAENLFQYRCQLFIPHASRDLPGVPVGTDFYGDPEPLLCQPH
jgi:hypothetical protein